MVQLRTQRTALALYAVLLVLPTLVLGFLQWHHIVRKKEDELAEVPRDAEDAALRFRAVLQQELDKLLRAESARGIDQYQPYFTPLNAPAGESPLLESSLRTDPRPRGVLGWFRFNTHDPDDGNVRVFFGGGEPAGALRVDLGDNQLTLSAALKIDAVEVARRADVESAARRLCQRFRDEDWIRRSVPMGLDVEKLELPMAVVASFTADAEDLECLRAEKMLLSDPVRLVAGHFQLHMYRDADGRPRLVAARRVVVDELPHLVGMTECLHRLSRGLGLVQGFFIDTGWYFDELPQSVAAAVLGKRERFLREGEECCDGRREYHAEVRLVSDFGIDAADAEDADFGAVRIAIDTQEVEQRFRALAWRFFGVAAMLALLLATGVFLLGRSVQKDLEQAARTENFVAAVTHELRTPLSAIRLHGEMLLEGWTKSAEQQQEYYRRIVRETERLSTLVERVLEKAKLSSTAVKPEPGDLSELVDAHVGQLDTWRTSERRDLEFELADELPRVMLTPDALHSILVNLVENARKYAPVDFGKPGAEPIRVVTRRCEGGAALEVLDRGPGIPVHERKRIFDAFYRMGDEATRTARGTGLGLHLVALHAESVGARAEVEDRPGGGSVFRVSFRAAPSGQV